MPELSEAQIQEETALFTSKKASCNKAAIATVALCIVAAVVVITFAVYATRPPISAELSFQLGVSSDRISAHLQHLTAVSHIAGSIADYDTALYVQNQMMAAGIPDVVIEPLNVLLSYPISRSVSVVSPVPYDCVLKEDVIPTDPSTSLPSVDTFLGYSGSGDITAELVYANFGRIADFEHLQSMGISVAGKIVIVRYGMIYRGNKVQLAEQFGAVGVIIYSDPQQDGFVQGKVYPEGPWRPASGVQRGSIWNGNGDPLTPGWPSSEAAPRITMEEVYNDTLTYDTPLSKIPSIPMSYGDAEHLLRQLQGASIPDQTWQGGLNFSYMIGPGPAQVHMNVVMNTSRTDIWNVIGKIEGGIESDRIVMLGNHRDAWTFGAGDPSSGTSALLEVATGLGALLQTGWKPRRSIWLCSWDAEEYALVGSVEYTELHEKELMARAVAYLNVDIAVAAGAGTVVFAPGGMPSLGDMMRDIAGQIPSPAGAAAPTLLGLWQNSTGLDVPVLSAQDMGTGSDYGGFIQHLGVASMHLEFTSAEDAYEAVYHSNYDDYMWMSKFGDPGFLYHAALTKVWGTVALRLADSMVLPFNYTAYAVALQGFVVDLEAQMTLDFTDLSSALSNLRLAAVQMEHALLNPQLAYNVLLQRQLNDRLFLAERAFLYLQGVPGREWYRHMVWVNGMFDGYASVAFSSVADMITLKDRAAAQFQIQLVSVVVSQTAVFLSGD